MDDRGNLYTSDPDLAAFFPEKVVRAVTPEALAKIKAKAGGLELTEDELRRLADMNRKDRRAALAEMRRTQADAKAEG